ncbi:hypothetical protein RND71_003151 [Anisodus tanguticus]|uniref:Ubiquitin-like protease family profile domain-containing protein n=1 Tax=Anisodus tanguticus TaxID=243964 RepID=A0AAE1VWY3_9SOLA|nr:hypothetical protein RND71_003151 [Anisodus tanguticus]
MSRLLIDWNKLIDDEAPAELVVATKAQPTAVPIDREEQNEELLMFNDIELTNKIDNLKRLYGSTRARLRDGGEKLKARIKKHENELERRKLLSSHKGTDGCVSFGRHHSGSIGVPKGLGQRSPQSAPPSQSAFAVCFSKKLEEKATSKTTNGFQNELNALNPCGRKRLTRQFSPRKRRKTALSSREAPFKFPLNIDEREFYADGKRRDISTSRYSEESFSSCFTKKWKPSQTHSACTLRHINVEPVVLVDEEEPDVVEPRQQSYHAVESTKATEIYYPSRNDPESVVICYSDMESLAPEAYLSSTIMNFYIRYLQQRKSLADGERFLIEEWKFQRQEVVADLPIADKIWENLPRRIDKKIIQVPQQKNDYDCGLFVLFFMERFIVEVDGRFRTEDLAMFGSKWFKPEEASSMRWKISDILEEKFKNSIDE